jgi:mannan endo-1,6-alpha-mannosidase
LWRDRIDSLLPRTLEVFFPKGVAHELACESVGTCTPDMIAYKGFAHRFLAETASLAPYTAATIMPVLRTSAAAAVAQCTGGSNGRFCGFKWDSGVYDGTTGACQQMDVLGALLSLLPTGELLTNGTGGTSVGNPNAGSPTSTTGLVPVAPITKGDTAGAAILTVIVLALGGGTYLWLSWGDK